MPTTPTPADIEALTARLSEAQATRMGAFDREVSAADPIALEAAMERIGEEKREAA
jgi:hypothetical protein